MPFPLLAGLAGSLGGSLIGGLFGQSAQAAANAANIRLARENRDWEERMSNTAWERSTADMLKAGINPMLAVSQGGASTPNNSAATVIPEDAMARAAGSMGSKILEAILMKKAGAEAATAQEQAKQEMIKTEEMEATSAAGTGGRLERDAISTQLMRAQYDLMKEDTNFRRAQTALANADTSLKEIEYKLKNEVFGYNVASARAQSILLERDISFREIQTALAKLDLPEKRAIADWFEAMGSTNIAAKSAMTITQWLQMIFGRNR